MRFTLRRGLVAFVLGLLVAAPGLVMAGDCDLCGMNERGDCVHASDLGQNDPSKDLKCAICHHVGKCKYNLSGRARSSPSPPSPPPPVTKQADGLAATGQRRLTQYDFGTDVSGQDFSKAPPVTIQKPPPPPPPPPPPVTEQKQVRPKGMRLNGPALVHHFAQDKDATGP